MNENDLFNGNAAEQRREHHDPTDSEAQPDGSNSHVSEAMHEGADNHHHHEESMERKKGMKNRSIPTLTGFAIAIVIFLSQTAFAGNTRFTGEADRAFESGGFRAEIFNARNAERDFDGFSFAKDNFDRFDISSINGFAFGGFNGFGFDGNFKDGNSKAAGAKAAFTLNNRNANARSFNRDNFNFRGRAAAGTREGFGFFGRDFAGF